MTLRMKAWVEDSLVLAVNIIIIIILVFFVVLAVSIFFYRNIFAVSTIKNYVSYYYHRLKSNLGASEGVSCLQFSINSSES